ncbi:hypothetical protein GDO81_028113 [Engystomops pustulosus]|uniref:Uncharacterized protein n=1 Tax=Engystomops pustulosus TaxID=76066 RepID=A0AAV6YF25_ENGPU|nr:hypothetical protein GDO81_028113 [Engystomops pustulosus]
MSDFGRANCWANNGRGICCIIQAFGPSRPVQDLWAPLMGTWRRKMKHSLLERGIVCEETLLVGVQYSAGVTVDAGVYLCLELAPIESSYEID